MRDYANVVRSPAQLEEPRGKGDVEVSHPRAPRDDVEERVVASRRLQTKDMRRNSVYVCHFHC